MQIDLPLSIYTQCSIILYDFKIILYIRPEVKNNMNVTEITMLSMIYYK